MGEDKVKKTKNSSPTSKKSGEEGEKKKKKTRDSGEAGKSASETTSPRKKKESSKEKGERERKKKSKGTVPRRKKKEEEEIEPPSRPAPVPPEDDGASSSDSRPSTPTKQLVHMPSYSPAASISGSSSLSSKVTRRKSKKAEGEDSETTHQDETEHTPASQKEVAQPSEVVSEPAKEADADVSDDSEFNSDLEEEEEKTNLEESGSADEVIAIYAFKAQSETQLTLERGEIVKVMERNPSGWWVGELKGKLGLFPGNYVRALTDAEKERRLLAIKVERTQQIKERKEKRRKEWESRKQQRAEKREARQKQNANREEKHKQQSDSEAQRKKAAEAEAEAQRNKEAEHKREEEKRRQKEEEERKQKEEEEEETHQRKKEEEEETAARLEEERKQKEAEAEAEKKKTEDEQPHNKEHAGDEQKGEKEGSKENSDKPGLTDEEKAKEKRIKKERAKERKEKREKDKEKRKNHREKSKEDVQLRGKGSAVKDDMDKRRSVRSSTVQVDEEKPQDKDRRASIAYHKSPVPVTPNDLNEKERLAMEKLQALQAAEAALPPKPAPKSKPPSKIVGDGTIPQDLDEKERLALEHFQKLQGIQNSQKQWTVDENRAKFLEEQRKKEKKNKAKLFFGKIKGEREDKDIGPVTNFKHEGHVGFKGKQGGLDLRNLPPQIQEFFNKLKDVLAAMGAEGDLSEKEIRLVLKGLPAEFFMVKPQVSSGSSSNVAVGSNIEKTKGGSAVTPAPPKPRDEKENIASMKKIIARLEKEKSVAEKKRELAQKEAEELREQLESEKGKVKELRKRVMDEVSFAALKAEQDVITKADSIPDRKDSIRSMGEIENHAVVVALKEQLDEVSTRCEKYEKLYNDVQKEKTKVMEEVLELREHAKPSENEGDEQERDSLLQENESLRQRIQFLMEEIDSLKKSGSSSVNGEVSSEISATSADFTTSAPTSGSIPPPPPPMMKSPGPPPPMPKATTGSKTSSAPKANNAPAKQENAGGGGDLSSVLAGLKDGKTNLKKVEHEEKPKPVEGRDGLLNEIRTGVQLKHVSDSAKMVDKQKRQEAIAAGDEANMLNIIARALINRRNRLKEAGEEEDNDDDLWGDD